MHTSMYIALHHFTEDKNMARKNEKFSASRRKFIKEGAAIGVGAAALAGVAAQEGNAAAQAGSVGDRDRSQS